MSVDALRGFDMFWILGADALVLALGGMSASRPVAWLAGQLEHKAWAGFAFYDLIFPLFVFIVGVSVVFSLETLTVREGRRAAVGRILRRTALLWLLGLFYNGGLSHAWPDVRIVGVLPRIAVAYGATGLLFLFCRPRTLAAIAAGLLLGYWALLAWVPIRNLQLDPAALTARLGHEPTAAEVRILFNGTTDRVTGHYEPGLNLTNHLDFEYLPGALYDRYYDPEGLLSTLPAIGTCLLGVFAGLLLRSVRPEPAKVRALLIAGALAVAIGWLWHLQFPVVKKLWTSSYVLVAAGYSCWLLATFHYVVEIRQWRGWCQPFVWIGMNPITLYLLSSVVGFRDIAARLVGGSVQAWIDGHIAHGLGELVVTLVGLGVVFAVAGFLYRRKIFLRV
jgi:predicted acyltransferase